MYLQQNYVVFGHSSRNLVCVFRVCTRLGRASREVFLFVHFFVGGSLKNGLVTQIDQPAHVLVAWATF